MRNKKEAVKQVSKTSKTKIKKPSEKLWKLRTGITLLDLVLNGGYPLGTINNIVGDTSSGKTFIAIEYIAFLKSIFGDKIKFYYDDCEGGFSFDTKAMYGLEIIPDDQIPSNTVEDMAVNLNSQMDKLKKEESLIYVVDSLDGLSSEAERKRDIERQKAIESGKEYDKGTYAMEKQKFMSEFFRLRAGEIKHENVIQIVISQVRHNIGVMFGEKYVRSGGKALDFYCWSALWLAVAEKIKKKDRIIGVTIKAKTKKIKAGQPFRECFLNLLFDYGIDNVSSNIDFLYDLKDKTGKLKTIKKREDKKKLKWDEEEYTRTGLIKHIEDNDLEDELEKRVIEKWDSLEDLISSKERKKKW